MYIHVDIAFKLDFLLCKLNRLVAQFLASVSLFVMTSFLFGVVLLPCVVMYEVLECAICGNTSPARNLVTIHAKGSDGINHASVLRNDNISVASGLRMHPNFRRDYCHPTNISKNNRRHENASSQLVTNQRRRSAAQTFDFKTGCYFCGNKVDFKSSDTSRSEERRVGKECRSWWSPYH